MSTSLAPLPEVPLAAPAARSSAPAPARRSRQAGAVRDRAAGKGPVTAWFEKYVEMSPSSGSADGYLDGLRGMAVLVVMTIHVYQHSNEPHIAFLGDFIDTQLATASWPVPMFFTLSAYLLAKPWFAAHLEGRRPPRLTPYYVRRFARLAPAYYLSIAALLLVFVPLGMVPVAEITGSRGGWNIALHLSFLQHLVPTSAGHFAGIGGVYWTLTIEFLFYLSLPLFVRWFLVSARPDRIPLLCLGISLAWMWLSLNSVGWLVNLLQGRAGDAVAAGMRLGATEADMRVLLTHQFPTWMFCFAVGLWLARAMVRQRAGLPVASWLHAGMGPWVTAAGVLAIIASGELARSLADPGTPLAAQVQVVIPGVQSIGVGLVLIGLTVGGAGLRRPMEVLPLRFIGWVSYGLYLFHVPVLTALTNLTGFATTRTPGGFVLLYLCTAVITTVLATICWMFVERPSMLAAQALLKRSAPGVRLHLGRRVRGVLVGAALIMLPALLVGHTGIQRGAQASYLGPIGQIRNVSLMADQTGPLTLDDALARGYLDEPEHAVLSGCGATEGISEGLSDQRWGGMALVFSCANADGATQALAAMPAVESARGFTRFDTGEHTVMLHEMTEATPGARLPYVLHVRYRSGARLISVSLSCRSRIDGQRAIMRVIEPALRRFVPSV